MLWLPVLRASETEVKGRRAGAQTDRLLPGNSAPKQTSTRAYHVVLRRLMARQPLLLEPLDVEVRPHRIHRALRIGAPHEVGLVQNAAHVLHRRASIAASVNDRLVEGSVCVCAELAL